MVVYHLIKFGCKKISSLADRVGGVIFDQMSPHCDPELEGNKPIFLLDTLAYDDASPYQVWLQKVKQLRRYHPHEHSLEFWTFSVTLALTTTVQLNLFTRQFSLWWCAMKLSLVAKEAVVQMTLKSCILIMWFLTVTMTLKTANQSFGRQSGS